MDAKRPHVLIITSDQQRFDSLGINGNPVIRTPTLDRLAREGVSFNRSYASCPVCMPSRASMFTGRYPKVHGCWHVGVPLPETEMGMSHFFREAGYRTANIGKLHLGCLNQLYQEGVDQCAESMHRNKGIPSKEVDRFWTSFQGDYYGFETFRSVLQHGNRTIGGGHYDLWLRENHPEALQLAERSNALDPLPGATDSWKSALPAELHYSNWIANETIRYIENQDDDRPFFIWCNFPDPHHPHCPPSPYCDMYDAETLSIAVPGQDELATMPPHHQKYFRGSGMDSWPADTYKSIGIAGNLAGVAGTVAGNVALCDMPEKHIKEAMSQYYGLITLMDDAIQRILDTLDRYGLSEDTIVVFNSDHGDLMGDHGLMFKGPFHYESVINIPTIWRWKGRLPENVRTDALMSHVDLFPTLIEACGLKIPTGVQGISQMTVLKGEQVSVRNWVLIEHRENVGDLQTKTLVTPRYKLTIYPGKTYGELFDLKQDPKEYHNLWADPAWLEVKQKLAMQMLESLCLTEDPLPERVSYS